MFTQFAGAYTGFFMRVAYVCRALSDDRLIGEGAEVYSSACAAARAGHTVYLVSATLAGYRTVPCGPVHVPVAAVRAGHRYLAEPLEYADRVYDALRALHLTGPLDVVEFAGSEAFTVLRARRLLGEFAGVRLVVTGRPDTGDAPVSLAAALTRHAEEYCRRHADEVVPERPADPVPAPGFPPGRPAPRAEGASGSGAAPSGLRSGATREGGASERREASGRGNVEVAEPELVSVVIPVHNQSGYLDGAIDSAWRCGYRPLEVLVVDDGSTEAVPVDRPDCTVLRLPHRGLPAARNAGIAAAQGSYVVPLDADDLLPPGFVGPAVAALRRDPGIGAVAGTVRNFGLLDHVAVPVGYVPDVSLVVNTFARATAVMRASAVAAAGGYDETLPAYEDWDLYLRLHKAGFAVECAPVVGQLYRRHADSMTFRLSDGERVALVQRLLRTHADLLTGGAPAPLLLMLVDLWKSRYEPSASVRWREHEPAAA